MNFYCTIFFIVSERKLFQGHRDIVNYKRVAIISSSASTGFNLHSALEENVHNKEPRIHITIEVGWAAEGLLQQLGNVICRHCF